jgi:hypothetical protein
LVLPPSGPKPVGATEKLLLVDGVQQTHHHLLHELILQDRNRDRPLFPILFGDIYSAQWLSLVPAFFEPLMELSDVLLDVVFVLFVRDPVDSRTGILSQTPECLIHLLHCDQVSDRKQLSLRILLSEFSYSVDVCAHTVSSSVSRDVSFPQIPTPASPFPPVDTVAAPCGSPAVLPLRRYYGVVRLLPHPSLLPPVDPWLHVPPHPFQRRSSWCERR